MKNQFVCYLIFCCISFWTISCRTTTEFKSDYSQPELLQQQITDADRTDTNYADYKKFLRNGPVIPGLFQGAVPQGLSYSAQNNLLIISNYMFDQRPSCITVLSMDDMSHTKTLWLINPDGTPHKGHVGGLAAGHNYLWIASDKGIFYVSLDLIQQMKSDTHLQLEGFIPTDLKASFATLDKNILWIGEFTSRDGSYKTSPSHTVKTTDGQVNHAWLAGFAIENLLLRSNVKPEYILSIPDEVQGAAFLNDRIFLSQSYGRKNNSRISVYRDPLRFNSNNNIEKISVLSNDSLELELTAPPMTEGIVLYKDSLAILFESGSDKYRATASNPQDHIHFLQTSALLNESDHK